MRVYSALLAISMLLFCLSIYLVSKLLRKEISKQYELKS